MPPNTSGIYRIHSPVNGRTYVGSAVDIRKRWWNHRSDLCKNKHPNSHLQRAWNKYGEDAFEFTVLEECPVETLIEREQHHLSQCLDTYNLAPVTGSQLGYRHTPEAKAKISAASRGRVISDETRAKMSEAQKGRMASPETREKIRQAAALRKHTPETRAKIADANRRRVVTDEYRKKMSESLKSFWERRRLNAE